MTTAKGSAPSILRPRFYYFVTNIVPFFEPTSNDIRHPAQIDAEAAHPRRPMSANGQFESIQAVQKR
jgi:hypothetical protein